MTRPSAREVAGKKFLWDGVTYLTRDDARQALEAYKKDGFEVHMFLEEDQYLVIIENWSRPHRHQPPRRRTDEKARVGCKATPFFLKTGEL